MSRDTPWQLLENYQYRRIDTFLDPSTDPLGAGYHITQSKIALGSGGWTGRGFMQGTQSRLNFVPEKHTDFIFTTLAEEFGFIGAFSLLTLYATIILFCVVSAFRTTDRFASLLILGVAATFFLFFAVNMLDGHGLGARGRRAIAPCVLWRLSHAGHPRRLRARAKRPYPPTAVESCL